MISISFPYDFHQNTMQQQSNIHELALRLQSIFNASIDGIITINTKGVIEFLNPAAAKQFEYSPEEIIGKNVSMLMPTPHRQAHDGYIQQYLKTKKARIIGIGREVRGLKKSGKTFPFRLAVNEVILNDRVLFTGIIHDLTDIKKAEQDLVNLNKELEAKVVQRTNQLESAVNRLLKTNKTLQQREAQLRHSLDKEIELNELKSRFVSMASHEFRTPLSTIMSSASLIARYPTTEQNDKRLKHVHRIKSAVSNLTGILNDFLSLSKIEEGKIHIVYTDVDIRALCTLVRDELRGILREGQHISLEIAEEVTTLRSDERVLKNILFNILSNAIKYSPPHQPIVCKSYITDQQLVFDIIDRGIGIPLNEQKHLFTRFYRASNVENIQGTGLGLSIVKRYADMLGGTLSFVSEQGKGTTFCIRLPLRKEH